MRRWTRPNARDEVSSAATDSRANFSARLHDGHAHGHAAFGFARRLQRLVCGRVAVLVCADPGVHGDPGRALHRSPWPEKTDALEHCDCLRWRRPVGAVAEFPHVVCQRLDDRWRHRPGGDRFAAPCGPFSARPGALERIFQLVVDWAGGVQLHGAHGGWLVDRPCGQRGGRYHRLSRRLCLDVLAAFGDLAVHPQGAGVAAGDAAP